MKMDLRRKVLLLLLLVVFVAKGQSFEQTAHGIKAVVDDVTVEIQYYSPKVVRIIKSPANRTFTKESLSVIASPQNLNLVVDQVKQVLRVKSKQMQVQLDLETGQLSFADAKGQPLLQEQAGGAGFVPFKDVEEETFRVKQSFVLDKEEAIYGLGDRKSVV